MTVEEAIYYKYLLLCGYWGELEQYVDEALEKEDPLSRIILELATCGSDHRNALTLLNSFILSVPKEQIDHSRVFSLVLAFLRRLYREEGMPMGKLTELMYRISVTTEDPCKEPWHTMNIMEDLYYEAQIGFIPMDSYTGQGTVPCPEKEPSGLWSSEGSLCLCLIVEFFQGQVVFG